METAVTDLQRARLVKKLRYILSVEKGVTERWVEELMPKDEVLEYFLDEIKASVKLVARGVLSLESELDYLVEENAQRHEFTSKLLLSQFYAAGMKAVIEVYFQGESK